MPTTLRQVFGDIANAIRSKTKKTDAITPLNMASEINEISESSKSSISLSDYDVNYIIPTPFIMETKNALRRVVTAGNDKAYDANYNYDGGHNYNDYNEYFIGYDSFIYDKDDVYKFIQGNDILGTGIGKEYGLIRNGPYYNDPFKLYIEDKDSRYCFVKTHFPQYQLYGNNYINGQIIVGSKVEDMSFSFLDGLYYNSGTEWTYDKQNIPNFIYFKKPENIKNLAYSFFNAGVYFNFALLNCFSNTTNMSGMFMNSYILGCTNTSIYRESWMPVDLPNNVSDISYMFYNIQKTNNGSANFGIQNFPYKSNAAYFFANTIRGGNNNIGFVTLSLDNKKYKFSDVRGMFFNTNINLVNDVHFDLTECNSLSKMFYNANIYGRYNNTQRNIHLYISNNTTDFSNSLWFLNNLYYYNSNIYIHGFTNNYNGLFAQVNCRNNIYSNMYGSRAKYLFCNESNINYSTYIAMNTLPNKNEITGMHNMFFALGNNYGSTFIDYWSSFPFFNIFIGNNFANNFPNVTDISYLFAFAPYVDIYNRRGVDSSSFSFGNNIINASGLFYGWSQSQNVRASVLPKCVEDASYMFVWSSYNDNSLSLMNAILHDNTYNITNIQGAFMNSGIWALFNNKETEYMSDKIVDCSKLFYNSSGIQNNRNNLQYLVLGNNVVNAAQLFFNCQNLNIMPSTKLVDLSYATNLQNISGMFHAFNNTSNSYYRSYISFNYYDVTMMNDINYSRFNNLLDISYLYCNHSISSTDAEDAGSFQTAMSFPNNLRHIDMMFANCPSIGYVPNGGFKKIFINMPDSVLTARGLYYNTRIGLTNLMGSNFNGFHLSNNLLDASSMFENSIFYVNNSDIFTIDIPDSVINMSRMFYNSTIGSSQFPSIYLNFNKETSNLKDISYLFYNSNNSRHYSSTIYNLPDSIENANNAFYNHKTSEISIPKNLIDGSYMYYSSLSSNNNGYAFFEKLSAARNLYYGAYMFDKSASNFIVDMTGVNPVHIKFDNLRSAGNMFNGLNITNGNAISFDLSNSPCISSLTGMFAFSLHNISNFNIKINYNAKTYTNNELYLRAGTTYFTSGLLMSNMFMGSHTVSFGDLLIPLHTNSVYNMFGSTSYITNTNLYMLFNRRSDDEFYYPIVATNMFFNARYMSNINIYLDPYYLRDYNPNTWFNNSPSYLGYNNINLYLINNINFETLNTSGLYNSSGFLYDFFPKNISDASNYNGKNINVYISKSLTPYLKNYNKYSSLYSKIIPYSVWTNFINANYSDDIDIYPIGDTGCYLHYNYDPPIPDHILNIIN